MVVICLGNGVEKFFSIFEADNMEMTFFCADFISSMVTLVSTTCYKECRVCEAHSLTFKFAKRGITEANLLVMANHLLSSSIMTDPALTMLLLATLQPIGRGRGCVRKSKLCMQKIKTQEFGSVNL